MLRRAGFRARPGAGALIEYELALRRRGAGRRVALSRRARARGRAAGEARFRSDQPHEAVERSCPNTCRGGDPAGKDERGLAQR
jgi:hypothetical protein